MSESATAAVEAPTVFENPENRVVKAVSSFLATA
jgi:hypothetical protein